RVGAARALGRLDAKEGVQALREFLKDSKNVSKDGVSIRGWATHAMGELGGMPGVNVVPDLITLLNDPEYAVRVDAARALGRLGPKEAERDMRLLLHDPEIAVRNEMAHVCVAAAEALGWLGAAEAVPDLRALLGRDSALLREAGARALGRLGPAAE